MVTVGGSEAITIAMQTCVNEGDEIIIPEPFYANYNGFACMSNVVVKPILSYIDNGFALPPIAEFEKLITEKQRQSLFATLTTQQAIYIQGKN